jgi:hypothetical protein
MIERGDLKLTIGSNKNRFVRFIVRGAQASPKPQDGTGRAEHKRVVHSAATA